jgi:hypothetical protein
MVFTHSPAQQLAGMPFRVQTVPVQGIPLELEEELLVAPEDDPPLVAPEDDPPLVDPPVPGSPLDELWVEPSALPPVPPT